MEQFSYIGYNKLGKKVKGEVEAPNEQRAIKKLLAGGIIVEKIKSKSAKGGGILNAEIFAQRVSNKEIADMFFQVSLMINSGIPLVQALSTVERNVKSKKLKSALQSIAGDVVAGVRFSDAMSKHSTIFEAIYVQIIKAGEQTGKLADILLDISSYLENKDKTFNKFVGALTYPLVVVFVSLIVFFGLLTVIVPMVQKIFENFNQELPFITRFFLGLSDITRAYGLYILVILTLSFVWFIKEYKKNGRLRLEVDKRLYKLDLVSNTILAQYTHITSFQLKEGLPLVDALHYANQTVFNLYIKSFFLESAELVKSGTKFSVALRNQNVFPELFFSAVATGEKSGNISELLERVSAYYIQRMDSFISIIISVIQPVFIVFIGLLVSVMIIAIMLPLLDINSMVG